MKMPAHCSSCGSTNREDLMGSYSSCCNKRVCDEGGTGPERFGTPNDFVRACCWGAAEIAFGEQSREIPEDASNMGVGR